VEPCKVLFRVFAGTKIGFEKGIYFCLLAE
jgi:hypothetical protein